MPELKNHESINSWTWWTHRNMLDCTLISGITAQLQVRLIDQTSDQLSIITYNHTDLLWSFFEFHHQNRKWNKCVFVHVSRLLLDEIKSKFRTLSHIKTMFMNDIMELQHKLVFVQTSFWPVKLSSVWWSQRHDVTFVSVRFHIQFVVFQEAAGK